MDGLVANSRIRLTLTNEVLQVLFKALLVLQEAHGYIIICVTVIQLWEECPKKGIEGKLMHLTFRFFNNENNKKTRHQELSSLAVEGLDLVNVPEYGVLVAAELRWCIRTVSMLQVMGGKEVHLFDKLRFTIYQVLDQLAEERK